MRAVWLVAAALLAGCAGQGGAWVKPGVEEAAAGRADRECRAVAAAAVGTEADIDQDIIATRQRDWQRSGTSGLQSRALRESTSNRAAAIAASCMRGKGFERAP